MKTTKCKTCNTYPVVLIADRAQPSVYAEIAEQSDSDPYTRFVHIHPVYHTDQCYYCTKKSEGRIGRQESYGYSYGGRDK